MRTSYTVLPGPGGGKRSVPSSSLSINNQPLMDIFGQSLVLLYIGDFTTYMYSSCHCFYKMYACFNDILNICVSKSLKQMKSHIKRRLRKRRLISYIGAKVASGEEKVKQNYKERYNLRNKTLCPDDLFNLFTRSNYRAKTC